MPPVLLEGCGKRPGREKWEEAGGLANMESRKDWNGSVRNTEASLLSRLRRFPL
jgi:hypothetical protein